MFKPKIKSQKIENLYYTGQLTSPGPGVPPSLISGIVVSNLIEKKLNNHSLTTLNSPTHESIV
jgi:phytoene desaturase